jgi:hypothetical protein
MLMIYQANMVWKNGNFIVNDLTIGIGEVTILVVKRNDYEKFGTLQGVL